MKKGISKFASCMGVAVFATFISFGIADEAYANCAGMKAAMKGVKCEKKVMIECPASSRFFANNGSNGAFTGPHGAAERGNFTKDGYGSVETGSELGPEGIVKELCSENNKWKATTGKCTCPEDKAADVIDVDNADVFIFPTIQDFTVGVAPNAQ